MERTRQILTAVGTLGCAAAIGFFMQSSDSAKRLYGASSVGTIALPDHDHLDDMETSDALLNVQDITLTSGELAPLSVDVPDTDTEVVKSSAPQTLAEPTQPQTSPTLLCDMTARARPMAAAMVDLTLFADCLPNERVTVHHNGMIFSAVTDAGGALSMTVPALARDAVFILAFTNGDGAVAQAEVEDIEDFDRVVLQWKGDTGFQIHAREFGADYGSAGHIWHDAPGEIAAAVTGESGFTTRHGDTRTPDALMAEVYSFPKAATSREGIVDLSVETEVTESNCGLEIEAQALQIEAGEMQTRNLTLSVPDCDAAGSFLVLNNLLLDLKVAAK